MLGNPPINDESTTVLTPHFNVSGNTTGHQPIEIRYLFNPLNIPGHEYRTAKLGLRVYYLAFDTREIAIDNEVIG